MSELDNSGIVGLVSEWVFEFYENYVGFREAGLASTFVDFFGIKF